MLCFNSGMILTAKVPHTIEQSELKKVPSYLYIGFLFLYSHKFTKVTLLLSSHGTSCLSGCLSRNRKNLEFTHPFIQKHKQLNPFLEKSEK